MSEELSAEQIEIFRRMTPAQKLHAAFLLRASAIAIKKAYLRSLDDTRNEIEIEKEIRDWLLYGVS